jgi:hypothetical protein
VLIAGAVPERIERVALIDGLVPDTGEADKAPKKLGEALLAHIDLAAKKKTIYESVEQAVQVRMRGFMPVSQLASELLAQRGLSPVAGGYSWSSDSRLTLPSPLRLTRAHAAAFVQAVQCPMSLILAEQGVLTKEPDFIKFLSTLNLDVQRLPGGHHLHLDDEQGALAVAESLQIFFSAG